MTPQVLLFHWEMERSGPLLTFRVEHEGACDPSQYRKSGEKALMEPHSGGVNGNEIGVIVESCDMS